MLDIKKMMIICVALMLTFSGCGKSKNTTEETTAVINEVGTDYLPEEETPTAEPVTEIAEFGEVCQNGSVSFEVLEITKEGTVYDDSDTMLVIAKSKITNNTSERIEPSSLSYFVVYDEDGNYYSGTGLNAFSAAARSDEKAFFADGIDPGESLESNVFLEIPQQFEKLFFGFCPETVGPYGYAPDTLYITFTPDDIK